MKAEHTLDWHAIRQQLKQKGFNAAKVELEIQINGTSECGECDGNGRRDCSECEGSGTERCGYCDGSGTFTVEDAEGKSETLECTNCDGSGHIDCYSCDGSGSFECDYCDGSGRCENTDSLIDDFDSEFRAKLDYAGLTSSIAYLHTYHDGSVDVESTLTVALRYLHKLPQIISLFVDTAKELDNSGDYCVENAGMHVSVLQTTRYPCERRLPEAKIRNFHRSMSKIVDALYLFSCANEYSKDTRGIGYRSPRVSASDKYSAIYTHGDTCLEYRIFDTCYDNPDRIRSYFDTIVRTLKFYSDKYRPPMVSAEVRAERVHGDYGHQSLRELVLGSPLYHNKTAIQTELLEAAKLLHPDKKKCDMLLAAAKRGTVSPERIITQLIPF